MKKEQWERIINLSSAVLAVLGLVLGMFMPILRVQPFGPGQSLFGLAIYTLGNGNFVSPVLLFIAFLMLLGLVAFALISLFKVDLFEIVKTPGFLTILLGLLGLNTRNPENRLVFLSIVFSSIFTAIALFVPITLTRGDLLGTYGLLFLLVGIPLILLSVARTEVAIARFTIDTSITPPIKLMLEIRSGPLSGGHPRVRSRQFSIGSSNQNDLVLFNDARVRPEHHVIIYFHGRTPFIRAYDHIYINRAPAAPGDYPLADQTVLVIGHSEMRVHFITNDQW